MSLESTTRFLTLPGWRDSGPAHWQSRWEALHAWQRVVQADWEWPRRGDWVARLDAVLNESRRPTVLIAHSLGCHLVAAWAATTASAELVRSALLVAPPDVERADMPPNVADWNPRVRSPLPFPSLTVFSAEDPYCAPEQAQAMANEWGSTAVNVGPRGHLNSDSGLGDWPEGLALLHRLPSAGP